MTGADTEKIMFFLNDIDTSLKTIADAYKVRKFPLEGGKTFAYLRGVDITSTEIIKGTYADYEGEYYCVSVWTKSRTFNGIKCKTFEEAEKQIETLTGYKEEID